MSKKKMPAKRRIEVGYKDDALEVSVPGMQPLLELFGTDDKRLASALLMQAAAAGGSTESHAEGEGITFVVDMVADLAPRDATERLLTMQMAATHAGMMQVSAKMNNAGHMEAHAVYSISFNRLARTFTSQVEAFRKHRNGGNSKVTVEHVTVNEGGQAIVGSVAGGRGNVETE